MSHPFEELMKRDLPQTGRDVVLLRQDVVRSGKSRIEGELQERIMRVGKSGRRFENA